MHMLRPWPKIGLYCQCTYVQKFSKFTVLKTNTKSDVDELSYFIVNYLIDKKDTNN